MRPGLSSASRADWYLATQRGTQREPGADCDARRLYVVTRQKLVPTEQMSVGSLGRSSVRFLQNALWCWQLVSRVEF